MPLPRRDLLRFGGAIAAALAVGGVTGCTPNDPRVQDPSTTPYGSLSPSAPGTVVPALPGATEAALVEADLLTMVTAIRDHPRYPSLPGTRRRLLHGLQTQHRLHVVALESTAPTSRPTMTASASASDTPPNPSTTSATSSASTSTAVGSLDDLISGLAAAERAAAARHLARATTANGFAGLLFASLTTAADTYAYALGEETPVAPVRPGTVAAYTFWTGDEAEQNLLAQTHAAIYGLKAALGFIGESTEPGRGLYARAESYERLRDQLRALLIEHQQHAPVAQPGYRLPLRVTDRASGLELARRVETAMIPHVGRWVAAVPDPTLHAQAVDLLRATAASAGLYGAGVQVWPGWL